MKPTEEPLAAWLRGELTADEERALRDAAAADPARAAELDAYDRTIAALRALPREREPETDLFPLIAARIEAAAPPARRIWPLGLAAGLMLLAGLALLLRLTESSRPPAPSSAAPQAVAPAPALPATSAIARSAYGDTDRALADIRRELRRTIEERQHNMPPETRALVFENLRVIEQAIADIEAALAAAPADADLARTYIAYRERQIDLLRQVNRMAARL
jgi:hypothetical protein